MRTTSALAMLLATSMLLCMIPVTNAGSAPTNGGVVSVSTDETWNIGSELDAIVTVQAGATLTIEGDYTLPEGASITVAGWYLACRRRVTNRGGILSRSADACKCSV